ncbi:MAG: antibiotic biosynthesis monooxygenase [Desulfohalobiaceae bacterium]|nr:antibiotic biosynthesis monooxygenase [Desulfohalobiaceae bacterium]
MIKVLIKRKVPTDKGKQILPLFKKMRSLAMEQPGYISGETLRNYNDPEEYLVISVWNSAQDWQNWLESRERQQVQDEIDELLGGRTEYSVYHHGL